MSLQRGLRNLLYLLRCYLRLLRCLLLLLRRMVIDMIFLWITVHDLLGLLTLFLCIFLSFLRLEIGHIQLSACISLLRLIHCLCLSLTLSILFLGRSIFLAILLLGEGHSMIPYPFWMTILHLGLVVGTEGNLITNRFFDSRKS